MIDRRRWRRRGATRGLLAAGVIAAIGTPAVAQGPGIPGCDGYRTEIYGYIQCVESHIVVPRPSATLRVGSFDALTRQFRGLTSAMQYRPGDRIGALVPPHDTVNAVDVSVSFEVVNLRDAGYFRVTANGRQVTALKGQTVVTIPVGEANTVWWTLEGSTGIPGSAGALLGLWSYPAHSDGLPCLRAGVSCERVVIHRPPLIGAGAFTIPILPLAIVYEPPMNRECSSNPNRCNRAIYAAGTQYGTATRVSLSRSRSSTSDLPGDADDHIHAAMQSIGNAAGQSDNPYAKAVGAALQAIAAILPYNSGTTTTGTQVTQQHTLRILQARSNVYPTSAHQGPGVGDVIVFLQGVRLAWLADSGRIRLAYLGHEALQPVTAGYLRSSGAAARLRLSQESIDALLALDPFVTPLTVTNRMPTGTFGAVSAARGLLSPSRFVPFEVYGVNGDQQHVFHYDVQQSDLLDSTQFTTVVDESHTGLLRAITPGWDDRTLRLTTMQGSTGEVTKGNWVEVTGEFFGDPDNYYQIQAYYDRVFGTIAFTSQEPSGEPTVSGVMRDAAGRVVPGSPVTLALGTQRLSTNSDAQGRYRFYAPPGAKGTARLTVGTVSRAIPLTGVPVRGLDLRVP